MKNISDIISPEIMLQAKSAGSAEQLMEIAAANGTKITQEEAAQAFAALKPAKTGELSDDELDNVAGGACHSSEGWLIVYKGQSCEHFAGIDQNADKDCINCAYIDSNYFPAICKNTANMFNFR